MVCDGQCGMIESGAICSSDGQIQAAMLCRRDSGIDSSEEVTAALLLRGGAPLERGISFSASPSAPASPSVPSLSIALHESELFFRFALLEVEFGFLILLR